MHNDYFCCKIFFFIPSDALRVKRKHKIPDALPRGDKKGLKRNKNIHYIVRKGEGGLKGCWERGSDFFQGLQFFHKK